MCLFTPLIAQNYKKIFKSRSIVLRTQHFPTHNNPFTLNKIFFAKIPNTTLIFLLASFIEQNFKIYLECTEALWKHYNFGSKMAHLPQPGIIFGKQFKFHFLFGSFYCVELKYDFHVPLAHFQCAKF